MEKPKRHTKIEDDAIALLLIEDDLGYASYIMETISDFDGNNQPFHREEFEDGIGATKGQEKRKSVPKQIKITHALSLKDGLSYLADSEIDVVLLDLLLPDSRGLETFERVKRAALDVPIVVLSAIQDEDIALMSVKEGAQDFLFKGDVKPGVLIRSLFYAIERKKVKKELRLSQEKLRAQYKGIPIPTITWQKIGKDFRLVDFNDAFSEVTEGKISEFLGVKASTFHKDEPELLSEIKNCYDMKTTFKREHTRHIDETGEDSYLESTFSFVPPDLVLVHTEDITLRKRSEKELRNSRDELETRVKERISTMERERKAFHIIAEAAVDATDVKDLCLKILTGLVETLEFNHGAIRLYDMEKNTLNIVAVVGMDEEEARKKFKSVHINDKFCISAHVARTRKAIFTPDVQHHEIYQTHRERLYELDIGALITWPILDPKDNLIGIMQLADLEPGELKREDRVFFEIVAGMFVTVIEHKRAGNALIESEERLRKMNQVIPLVFWVYSPDRNEFQYVSSAFEKIFGRPINELYENPNLWVEVVLPADKKRVKASISGYNGTEGELEYRIVRPDGEVRWLLHRYFPIEGGTERESTLVGSVEDITHRKRAEEALKESEEKFRNIVESSPMGIHMYQMMPDGSLIFIDSNPMADEILGIENSRFIGKTIEEAFPELVRSEAFEKYRLAASEGEPCQTEYIYCEDDKIKRALEIHTFQTSPMKMAAMFLDITDRKKMEEELRILSITDSLTGLFNQRLFYRKIHEEIERAKRMSYPLCLMIFDIDRFKEYNDTKGHLAGDEVLKKIGEITKKSIRTDVDSSFRYGGDEFAVILPSATEDDTRVIAKRISERISKETEGIGISIGIASLKDNRTVEDIINEADRFMYAEKLGETH